MPQGHARGELWRGRRVRAEMRAACLLLALTMTTTAWADPAACPAGTSLVSVRDVDGTCRRVCAIDVRARPQRPHPFAVVARGPAGYALPEPSRTLAPAVTAALRRAPF